MTNQQHQGDQHELNDKSNERFERSNRPECDSVTSPHISVVSTADHQRGHDSGWWIEADQDPDDLKAAIDRVLAESLVRDAREWAIHDWEGFGEFDPSGITSIEELSAVALGIAEHGDAFAAYVGFFGTDLDTCSLFERAYLGRWHSTSDYAQHFAEEMGWREQFDAVPDWLREFITVDWSKLASYLESEIDVVPGPNGMVYLFSSD